MNITQTQPSHMQLIHYKSNLQVIVALHEQMRTAGQ